MLSAVAHQVRKWRELQSGPRPQPERARQEQPPLVPKQGLSERAAVKESLSEFLSE
jgi:hypothetical protein